MQYMLLIYETERAEPGSADLAASIAAVNAFTAEVIERGVFVAAGALDTLRRDGRAIRHGLALIAPTVPERRYLLAADG